MAAPVVQQVVPAAIHAEATIPTGLTMGQIGEICQKLYMKMYNHIFMNCEPLTNSDQGFGRPEGVASVAIQLDSLEKTVVVKCDCLDVNGRWCGGKSTADGILRGYVTKDAKLPVYKVVIYANGQQMIRMIIPQNPGKRNGGQLSKPALQARGGARIMYVMEGDDNATGKKYIVKVVDGVMTAC
jgi:hypothetical protein